jgi:hypothetical protein
MATIIYLLCALTSGLCAVLLLRGYFKSRVRLLLWTGLCFVGLALNNAVLIFDLILFPEVPLLFFRNLASLLGVSVLVAGLIWDSK